MVQPDSSRLLGKSPTSGRLFSMLGSARLGSTWLNLARLNYAARTDLLAYLCKQRFLIHLLGIGLE